MATAGSSIGNVRKISYSDSVLIDAFKDKVAIGYFAGKSGQGDGAIAVGTNAGRLDQLSNAIAIGYLAGYDRQQDNAIGIGVSAGEYGQKYDAIAIGNGAGNGVQFSNAIAIGYTAGNFAQVDNAIAIGNSAGNNQQRSNAIALGFNAGNRLQNNYAIAIGTNAGLTFQNAYAVAIGTNAGRNGQGAGAIAIGNCAAQTGQWPNSIIIDANNSSINPLASGLYISPIRPSAATSNVLYYDPIGKEITFVAQSRSFPIGSATQQSFPSCFTGQFSNYAITITFINTISANLGKVFIHVGTSAAVSTTNWTVNVTDMTKILCISGKFTQPTFQVGTMNGAIPSVDLFDCTLYKTGAYTYIKASNQTYAADDGSGGNSIANGFTAASNWDTLYLYIDKPIDGGTLTVRGFN